MNKDLEKYLKSLRKSFPSQEIIGPSEIALIFGQKRKSIYNQTQAGTFPIMPFRINGRPKWRLLDVAKYLAKLN